MKKYLRYLFLIFLLNNLVGCVTIQTEIDNRDAYNVFQIESRRRFILFWDYCLSNYTMQDKGEIKQYVWNNEKIQISELVFLENNIKTSNIELIQRETKGLFFTNIRQFVKFKNGNGRSIEYEMHYNERNYFTVQDEKLGTVEFNYYRTNGFHTGFDIIVNNARYGIIAFYPELFNHGTEKPALFIKKENELKKEMAMYILTAYLKYLKKL